ncbi:MAG: DNA repair exonuclease SbcCD ATPase subunit [Lentimonas sp.]|jgi:DNA repair exonuclease SbcCD ATPase subunit
MTATIEVLEPAGKRAREAENKLLALQKESAALRGEYSQAHKRIEAAESAARDTKIQFERVEATLEVKDKALIVKQQESSDLARELDDRRTEISELVIEREKLLSMETALKEKLNEIEESSKRSERDRHKLNDEFTECRLELAETKEKLTRLKQMFDEQAATGENDVEQLQRLRDQLLDVETKLGRKESALKDLELVHADSTQETPYEAHKHMEWTLNHFDSKALTFKFNNLGARVFLVDVETSVPQLRHEFETGREILRGDDFESRIKVAIKKSEQRNMEELPGEFDMTVFYALNIYPIQFKIRPREGQKIERIK